MIRQGGRYRRSKPGEMPELVERHGTPAVAPAKGSFSPAPDQATPPSGSATAGPKSRGNSNKKGA